MNSGSLAKCINDIHAAISCCRQFYVSWLKGEVIVGRGYKAGDNVLLAAQKMKQHPVNAINIVTKGVSGR